MDKNNFFKVDIKSCSIEFIHSNIIFQRHLTNYIQLKKIYYNAQKINRLIIYTNNHKLNERRNVIEYNED